MLASGNTVLLFASLASEVFANGETHPPGTPHTDDAAAVSPVALVVLLGVVVVGGFLLWHFVLNKRGSTPQMKEEALSMTTPSSEASKTVPKTEAKES